MTAFIHARGNPSIHFLIFLLCILSCEISVATKGSLDDECEVEEVPSPECLDYGKFLDELIVLRYVVCVWSTKQYSPTPPFPQNGRTHVAICHKTILLFLSVSCMLFSIQWRFQPFWYNLVEMPWEKKDPTKRRV
jgi:hypothetical protein